ncbi:MAG: electron transport complex subunit RsxB [Burkholderiaceae bacterium]|nr:electron transport complex subunit RsxB [Burkholderiaceae bacterium]
MAINPTELKLIDAIDALLPQTQCTRCSYAACRPYAQAIAQGEADINQCPPGGNNGIAALAELLSRPVKPLNPLYGKTEPRRIAVIDESRCIGCTLCIQACPVDAILGAPKWMHAVVPEYCTGCELCIAPCPVDCIDLIDIPALSTWTAQDAQAAKTRFEQKKKRKPSQTLSVTESNLEPPSEGPSQLGPAVNNAEAAYKKQRIIQAALERARSRRSQSSTASKANP